MRCGIRPVTSINRSYAVPADRRQLSGRRWIRCPQPGSRIEDLSRHNALSSWALSPCQNAGLDDATWMQLAGARHFIAPMCFRPFNNSIVLAPPIDTRRPA